MANNWIITDQGEPLNLDYVAKVMWGGDFTGATSDQQKRLYIFHGGVVQVASEKGATTVYNYDNPQLAKAARDRIRAYLITEGAADLRLALATLTAITPATAVHAVPTVITLTGSGFIAGGTITINSIAHTVSLSAGTFRFTTDVSLAAGTYDVIYTDTNGGAATLVNGITIT